MQGQFKDFTLITLRLTLLAAVLMQSACKKDGLSREKFINEIKGNWYMIAYNHLLTPNNNVWVEIQVYEDGIFYSNENEQITYPFGDSILCSLPFMEKMQNWTISERNGDLLLETRDLCGVIKNYKMEYSNYRYHTRRGIGSRTDGINADITLINEDAIITLYSFSIYYDKDPIEMSFKIVTSNSKDSYNLSRID